MPTPEQIAIFCKEKGVSFYRLGCPSDWDDKACFRVSSHAFPAYGITVRMEQVERYFAFPPYISENI